jgi:hypothetical protein
MAKKKKTLAKKPGVSPRTRSMLNRAKLIDEAMRLVYDSLQSHLPYTHVGPHALQPGETTQFHKNCVKEYSRVLELLSKLY